MSRCMARREFDHDGAVAEDVMVLAVKQRGLAFFQVAKERRVRSVCASGCAGVFCEHCVALDLLHNPRGAGERVGVRDVIAVIVRQREISDIGGCVADRSELGQQRLGDREGPLRRGTGRLKVSVRNLAGIPHQRSAGMRDQVARRKHFRGCKLSGLESKGSLTDSSDFAAIENIQPDRSRSLSAARLLCGRERHGGQRRKGPREQNKAQLSSQHGTHITASQRWQ